MALIVETGTGVIGAEAYVDVAYVDSYAARFGKTATWNLLTTPDKEVKIRVAAQFLDTKYAFDVVPLTEGQGLLFPAEYLRVRGRAVTGLPRQLKDAAAELAIIAATIDLSNSVTARTYTSRKVKVGDLEKTEVFKSDDATNTFSTVELLLSPLLGSVPGSKVRTVRMFRS